MLNKSIFDVFIGAPALSWTLCLGPGYVPLDTLEGGSQEAGPELQCAGVEQDQSGLWSLGFPCETEGGLHRLRGAVETRSVRVVHSLSTLPVPSFSKTCCFLGQRHGLNLGQKFIRPLLWS